MSETQLKVTVAGASGGIGQPLSLLLKQNPNISELALYDLRAIKGLALELSHIDTAPVVKGYEGKNELPGAFQNADIIVFVAGLPRQPGMGSRAELLKKNGEIMRDLANAAAHYAPKSIICVITNPVNTLVPLIGAALEKAGHKAPHNVLGVTSVDIVRANTFVGRLKYIDPSRVNVPVIGGHSDGTMIPLFSQASPENLSFTIEEAEDLTKRVTSAGADVFNAKALSTGGTATLSVAYAAARLCSSILRGLKGEKDATDIAYVRSSVIPEVTYFSSVLGFGKNGIEKYLDIGPMSSYERSLLESAIPRLQNEIDEGIQFIANNP